MNSVFKYYQAFTYQPLSYHIMSLPIKEKNDQRIIKKFSNSSPSYISGKIFKNNNSFYVKVTFIFLSGVSYGIVSKLMEHYVKRILGETGITEFIRKKTWYC